MRVLSSQTLPPDRLRRPARQLSAVDLPQPDGPSKAMNSPRRTVRLTPLSALTKPKLRLIPSSRNSRKSRAAIAIFGRSRHDTAPDKKKTGDGGRQSPPPSAVYF